MRLLEANAVRGVHAEAVEVPRWGSGALRAVWSGDRVTVDFGRPRIESEWSHPSVRPRVQLSPPRSPSRFYVPDTAPAPALDVNRAVGIKRPVRIVRDFPDISIGISERSGCAAPVGYGSLTNDRSSSL